MNANTVVCPWCGQEEANYPLLTSNHWVRPAGDTGYDWCAAHQMCIGQELVLNHLRYEIRNGTEIGALEYYIDKAREKWAQATSPAKADADQVIAEAEARLDVLRRAALPPEHATVNDSEAVSLW